MKYMNIIKLLTVLLCIGMLFVACDSAQTDGTEETTNIENESLAETDSVETEVEETFTEEPLLENVEGKYENFFEVLDAEIGELSSAEPVEGEIFDYSDRLIVLKNVEIDAKNNVVETYTVYNTVAGAEVLTLTNEYFNGDYEEVDFESYDFRVFETVEFQYDYDRETFYQVEDSTKYRGSYLDVVVVENSIANLICVEKAEFVPIDEEIREANPEGCVYRVEVSYTYYDCLGNLITESSRPLDLFDDYYEDNSKMVSFALGAERVYLNRETGEFIRKSVYGAEEVSGIFEYENDMYGFYAINETSFGAGSMYFIDIVDKQSGELLRYNFDNGYEDFEVFYLNNGDLVIQYVSQVEESDPYDYYSNNNGELAYYSIKTVLLSVDDGKETIIEKPEFYIEYLVTGQEFAEEWEIAKINGILLSNNARNIAAIYNIKNGVISEKSDIIVLDNDLKVLYTYEKIVDRQVFVETVTDEYGNEWTDYYGLGYELLDSGDKLVYIGGGEHVIVSPEGDIRSYLTAGMWVVGDYVVDGEILYDYDLNVICNYQQKGYSTRELFGKCVFVSESIERDDYGIFVKKYRYMTFTVEGDQIILEDLFEDEMAPGGEQSYEFIFDEEYGYIDVIKYDYRIYGDYAVFRNAETGKYILYNESMTALIVSSEDIDIHPLEDGGYLVITNAGELRAYVLK